MGNYKILQIMRNPVSLYIFLIHCYNVDSSKYTGDIYRKRVIICQVEQTSLKIMLLSFLGCRMMLPIKEVAPETYESMYKRYIELKVTLTSLEVDLEQLDRVKG